MTDATTTRSRPFTGEEYLESLRDGREVYIYGQRVEDVTTHPAFRNTARMTARLFDALHDKEKSKKLLLPSDTDGNGMTHAFFKAPKTLEESIAGRDAIAEWQRLTYGWMGRSPAVECAAWFPWSRPRPDTKIQSATAAPGHGDAFPRTRGRLCGAPSPCRSRARGRLPACGRSPVWRL